MNLKIDFCRNFLYKLVLVMFSLLLKQIEGVQTAQIKRQEVVQGLWDASATRRLAGSQGTRSH